VKRQLKAALQERDVQAQRNNELTQQLQDKKRQLFSAIQEREGLRQQVRSLEDKCREFQEALQCKMCRAVSTAVLGGCAGGVQWWAARSAQGCACKATRTEQQHRFPGEGPAAPHICCSPCHPPSIQPIPHPQVQRNCVVLPCLHFLYCDVCFQKHCTTSPSCPACNCSITGYHALRLHR
jgi:hypothetical protein